NEGAVDAQVSVVPRCLRDACTLEEERRIAPDNGQAQRGEAHSVMAQARRAPAVERSTVPERIHATRERPDRNLVAARARLLFAVTEAVARGRMHFGLICTDVDQRLRSGTEVTYRRLIDEAH